MTRKARDYDSEFAKIWVATLLPRSIVESLQAAVLFKNERERTIAIDRAITRAKLLHPELFTLDDPT